MGLINLVENYIQEVLSIKDITDEYMTHMRRFNKDFSIEEPLYEVEMNVNCCGRKEVVIEIWTKGEYEAHISRGYYMA